MRVYRAEEARSKEEVRREKTRRDETRREDWTGYEMRRDEEK